MQILLGTSDYHAQHGQLNVPVLWDSQILLNPHLLVCGKSGTGKTHQLRRLVTALAAQGVRVHVFDVHGDIRVEGESRVTFSASAGYGYNPLVLDPHPHAGGVRRGINGFLGLLGRTSRRMGDRQEAVLRALLGDVYWLHGCRPDDPATWQRREVDTAEHQLLVQQRRYQELRQCYPTLDDLVQYTERKLRALYLGAAGNGGSRALTALEEVERLAAQLRRLADRACKPGAGDDEDLQKKLDRAREKAIAAYGEFVQAIETGRELDEALKYDSKETLRGVLDRLKNLQAAGIFSASPPPFTEQASAWVYDLRHLSSDEQLLLICTRAEAIFRQRLQAGEQPELCEVILVDEAHKFLGSEDGDIFRRIALEARKFGLGLWCSSQAPTHFSEDFLATVACKMLLGIDPLYWQTSARRLGIGEAVLKYVTPRQTAAVHMDQQGQKRAPFFGVRLAAV